MTNFEKTAQTSPLFEGLENSLSASAKFVQETWSNPEARARQCAAVADGVIVGGLKAIPDRIINHPKETIETAASGLVIGGALGAAAALESPVIAIGVAAGATALTCKYVYDLGTRLSGEHRLTGSLDNIWKSNDLATCAKSLPAIEQVLGKETFDLALLGTTGSYGFKGGGTLACMSLRPPLKLAFANAAAGEVTAKPLPSESSAKPETSFAMEAYRDRSGFIRYDRKAPEKFNNIIEQPLSTRLDHLEQLVKSGKKGEAYDFVNANLEWYGKRESAYDSVHGRASRAMLYIGTSLWSAVHEGNAGMGNKALQLIKEMRAEFAHEKTDWPLKNVTAEQAGSPERIKALSDKQRVLEIEKLVDAGFHSDASKIANWGYVIHRDARHDFLRDSFDMVLLETAKLSLKLTDASVPRCRERLDALKNAVGLK